MIILTPIASSGAGLQVLGVGSGNFYLGDGFAFGQLMVQCWCIKFFRLSNSTSHQPGSMPFVTFSLAPLTGYSQYLNWEEVYCMTPALDGYLLHSDKTLTLG